MYALSPRILLFLCATLATGGYFAVRFPDVPGTAAGSLLSTFLIALPALLAFSRRFGFRRSAYSLSALSLLGFGVELTGVVTGFPYGRFSYGDDLGPKVAGLVPYVLPVSWAPLVLGAVAATEPLSRMRAGRRGAGQVARATVLLVLFDAVLDPGAARLGFWTWPDGGAYYGVPLTNYAGWLLSSAVATTLLLRMAPWEHTLPVPGLLDSTLMALAFWTSVSVFLALWIPAALGAFLFILIWLRRKVLSGDRRLANVRSPATSAAASR